MAPNSETGFSTLRGSNAAAVTIEGERGERRKEGEGTELEGARARKGGAFPAADIDTG